LLREVEREDDYLKSMIEPITQEQFKKLFTPAKGPEGSISDRVQQRSLETKWYQDTSKKRIGLVIFDLEDGNWTCVTLEDCGDGEYSTHEVEINMASEKIAIETLMNLFVREDSRTRDFLVRMTRQSAKLSRKDPVEVLLIPPVITVDTHFAPPYTHQLAPDSDNPVR
jgi:hypothetical protein